MYQHQTLHYGTDFRKSIEHKSLNPFVENDQHGQSNFLIKRVVEHIRHKSLHDVACNAQTHEALSAATTQTPKPPPPTKASKLYVLQCPVLHGSALLTSKQKRIKTFYQACRRSTEPAQRQTYLHASTNGLSRFLKILITGVVRQQHKLNKRMACDFSEVVVTVPQSVLGSNPKPGHVS